MYVKISEKILVKAWKQEYILGEGVRVHEPVF